MQLVAGKNVEFIVDDYDHFEKVIENAKSYDELFEIWDDMLGFYAGQVPDDVEEIWADKARYFSEQLKQENKDVNVNSQ